MRVCVRVCVCVRVALAQDSPVSYTLFWVSLDVARVRNECILFHLTSVSKTVHKKLTSQHTSCARVPRKNGHNALET